MEPPAWNFLLPVSFSWAAPELSTQPRKCRDLLWLCSAQCRPPLSWVISYVSRPCPQVPSTEPNYLASNSSKGLHQRSPWERCQEQMTAARGHREGWQGSTTLAGALFPWWHLFSQSKYSGSRGLLGTTRVPFSSHGPWRTALSRSKALASCPTWLGSQDHREHCPLTNAGSIPQPDSLEALLGW